MSLKSMISKIEKARASYEAAKAEIGEEAQVEVGKLFGKRIPTGYELFWTQYTPYFNDGEPCTFSVHDPYIRKTPSGDSEEDDAEGFELSDAIKNYGVADHQQSYKDRDYSKPRVKDSKGYMDYPEITKEYTVHGFPAIEGYSKASLEKLLEVWKEFSEDFLERVFGDHVKIIITSDGECLVVDEQHD